VEEGKSDKGGEREREGWRVGDWGRGVGQGEGAGRMLGADSVRDRGTESGTTTLAGPHEQVMNGG